MKKETTSNERLKLYPCSERQNQEAQCAYEELLGRLQHDLRSPLGAISLLTDVIQNHAENGQFPDVKQMTLLQETVTKIQRVVDDAAEIQMAYRGSLPLNLEVFDLQEIITSCLEKVRHAPCCRNVSVNYDAPASRDFIRTDLEKCESVILRLFEETAAHIPRHEGSVIITQESSGKHVTLRLEAQGLEARGSDGEHSGPRPEASLHGRLGNRKLGESRYSLCMCEAVAKLMGGGLELSRGGGAFHAALRLPARHD